MLGTSRACPRPALLGFVGASLLLRPPAQPSELLRVSLGAKPRGVSCCGRLVSFLAGFCFLQALSRGRRALGRVAQRCPGLGAWGTSRDGADPGEQQAQGGQGRGRSQPRWCKFRANFRVVGQGLFKILCRKHAPSLFGSTVPFGDKSEDLTSCGRCIPVAVFR